MPDSLPSNSPSDSRPAVGRRTLLGAAAAATAAPVVLGSADRKSVV